MSSHKYQALKNMALALALATCNLAAAGGNSSSKHVFVCRSPVLALDFWHSLAETRAKGVEITPEVAAQICGAMRAGRDPQCRRIEVSELRPVAAGWSGALALADGGTKVWFTNPDAGGWVAPEYFVMLFNQASPAPVR